MCDAMPDTIWQAGGLAHRLKSFESVQSATNGKREPPCLSVQRSQVAHASLGLLADSTLSISADVQHTAKALSCAWRWFHQTLAAGQRRSSGRRAKAWARGGGGALL